jgi:hypothetical protein
MQKLTDIAFAYTLRQHILSAHGAASSVDLTKALVQIMDGYASTLNKFKFEVYQNQNYLKAFEEGSVKSCILKKIKNKKTIRM